MTVKDINFIFAWQQRNCAGWVCARDSAVIGVVWMVSFYNYTIQMIPRLLDFIKSVGYLWDCIILYKCFIPLFLSCKSHIATSWHAQPIELLRSLFFYHISLSFLIYPLSLSLFLLALLLPLFFPLSLLLLLPFIFLTVFSSSFSLFFSSSF